MRIVCWQTILMKYHTLFFRKLLKMSQNLSSAAVVIGSLKVKCFTVPYFNDTTGPLQIQVNWFPQKPDHLDLHFFYTKNIYMFSRIRDKTGHCIRLSSLTYTYTVFHKPCDVIEINLG